MRRQLPGHAAPGRHPPLALVCRHGLAVTNDILERRAIVKALRLLDERGVVQQMDGDMDGFVEDENTPVLLAIHHSWLSHVISNFGTLDPSEDPEAWLKQVEREPDPARRMRRRLIDDALVHVVDLDEAEADWLSRRVRGDDGAPLALAFGLTLERRAEGAALVVPEAAFRHHHELGTSPFPAPGTIPHAALLLCEHAANEGQLSQEVEGPGAGWRGLRETDVFEQLAALVVEHVNGRGNWRREFADNSSSLAEHVRGLLVEYDLLRVREGKDGSGWWWFSPATGRWAVPASHLRAVDTGPLADPGPQRPDPSPTTSETLAFDFIGTSPGDPCE